MGAIKLYIDHKGAFELEYGVMLVDACTKNVMDESGSFLYLQS